MREISDFKADAMYGIGEICRNRAHQGSVARGQLQGIAVELDPAGGDVMSTACLVGHGGAEPGLSPIGRVMWRGQLDPLRCQGNYLGRQFGELQEYLQTVKSVVLGCL